MALDESKGEWIGRNLDRNRMDTWNWMDIKLHGKERLKELPGKHRNIMLA